MREFIKNSLIILIVIIGISCNSTKTKSILLTTGLSSNPDERRFGIEIINNKIYYCEEINNGKYNYFEGEIDEKKLTDFYNNFNNFTFKIQNKKIIDAKIYRLDYTNNNKKKTIKFHLSELVAEDILIINKLIEFKNTIEFKKISYHFFPKELLLEQLPIPPIPNDSGK